jgi:hypothetical protein
LKPTPLTVDDAQRTAAATVTAGTVQRRQAAVTAFG